VLARLNRVSEASRSFDQALAAAPEDTLILREAGAFHYRKGDMIKAESLLDKAMRKDRSDYMASFFYARMLDETGRQNQAASYYRQVLRHVPEEPDVHEAFARSLGFQNKTAEAYIHLTYSAIYSNNKKQAERYFKKAQSLAERAPNRTAFQKLETIYKERKEVWEES